MVDDGYPIVEEFYLLRHMDLGVCSCLRDVRSNASLSAVFVQLRGCDVTRVVQDRVGYQCVGGYFHLKLAGCYKSSTKQARLRLLGDGETLECLAIEAHCDDG